METPNREVLSSSRRRQLRGNVLAGEGENDGEGGTAAEFAFDFEFTLVGFDDHFAVEHADAEAVPRPRALRRELKADS